MNELRKLSAVALKYPEDVPVPFISIKENGLLAKRMIEIAKENDVPIVKDDVLENVLSLYEVGSCIPENTWYAVAGIFAYIIRLENKNGGDNKDKM